MKNDYKNKIIFINSNYGFARTLKFYFKSTRHSIRMNPTKGKNIFVHMKNDLRPEILKPKPEMEVN